MSRPFLLHPVPDGVPNVECLIDGAADRVNDALDSSL